VAAAAVIAAAALAAVGCAVPLGPGYKIERQRLEAAIVRSPQPRVDVRASWRVKNTGDRPLTSLDVEIPDAQTHGLSRLRLESGGTEVAPARGARGHAVRIPLEQPLEMKARREIAVSYSLAGGSGAVAEDEGFVLPPGDWAPGLLPPEGQGSFARGSDPPKKWEFAIHVPAGFRVLASGRERGNRKDADGVEFRYQERRGGGLPFAAGGAYQEQRIASQGGAVIFWTRQAMPQGLAERAAVAAEWSTAFYNQEFGIREGNAWTVRVIECVSREACWAVPGAVLPGRELLTPDFRPSGVREMNRQLARTWLDFRVHPDWQEEPYPMGALADYAADLAAARFEGEGARQRIVHELLKRFAGMEKPAREPLLLNIRLSDPEAVRRAAELKSEMFFFALEDAAGIENLQRGLQHLLGTYTGGEWRASDLRSAVELECGKDLAALFRGWLTETAIPSDFRERYGSAPEPAHNASEER
jgi:hypothetical protein